MDLVCSFQRRKLRVAETITVVLKVDILASHSQNFSYNMCWLILVVAAASVVTQITLTDDGHPNTDHKESTLYKREFLSLEFLLVCKFPTVCGLLGYWSHKWQLLGWQRHFVTLCPTTTAMSLNNLCFVNVLMKKFKRTAH